MRSMTSLVVALVIAMLLPATEALSADKDGRLVRHRFLSQRLVVGFSRAASPSQIRSTLGSARAVEVARLGRLAVSVVEPPPDETAATLRRLRASRVVRFAELDGWGRPLEMVPNDVLWPNQWSPIKTGAPRVWDATLGSPEVTIAVLDSGVDMTHPDIRGRLMNGYDFVNDDALPADDNGHGTIVAGIIGARINNGIGIASYCGSCSILPVKVMDASGWAPWSAVAEGIVWATDEGANVINLSIGGASGNTVLHEAVRYAHERGVLLVAGAGNSGNEVPVYPAAYEEVIAVASSDENDSLYGWSTFGDWVDVAAPGLNEATTLGGGYVAASGTSTSSAVVSGIAGLALSASRAATGPQVRDAILMGAAPMTHSNGLLRADVYGALVLLDLETPTHAIEQGAQVEKGSFADRRARRFALPLRPGKTWLKDVLQ